MVEVELVEVLVEVELGAVVLAEVLDVLLEVGEVEVVRAALFFLATIVVVVPTVDVTLLTS